jgi:hypothetical protein
MPDVGENHPTELQRRLAARVREGLAVTGQSQADLSRVTGIGEPHISLLLAGKRAGTLAAWDKLIRAAGHNPARLRLNPGNATIDRRETLPESADAQGTAVNGLSVPGVHVGGHVPPRPEPDFSGAGPRPVSRLGRRG